MARKKVDVAGYDVAGQQVLCMFCQHGEFRRQEVKLTTTGMSALNLDWANPSAEGLTCTRCGYVHLFSGEGLRVQAG